MLSNKKLCVRVITPINVQDNDGLSLDKLSIGTWDTLDVNNIDGQQESEINIDGQELYVNEIIEALLTPDISVTPLLLDDLLQTLTLVPTPTIVPKSTTPLLFDAFLKTPTPESTMPFSTTKVAHKLEIKRQDTPIPPRILRRY